MLVNLHFICANVLELRVYFSGWQDKALVLSVRWLHCIETMKVQRCFIWISSCQPCLSLSICSTSRWPEITGEKREDYSTGCALCEMLLATFADFTFFFVVVNSLKLLSPVSHMFNHGSETAVNPFKPLLVSC